MKNVVNADECGLCQVETTDDDDDDDDDGGGQGLSHC